MKPTVSLTDQHADLRAALLSATEAERLDAPGQSDAAVLVPLYGWPRSSGVVLTRRHDDLRRHGGEISFPGGVPEGPGEDPITTALRESEEEIGLARSEVEVVGALPPVGTFVTSYRVLPIVGVIRPEVELVPNPDEVAAVLRISIDELLAGYGNRRVIRRGIPIMTQTYLVEDALIWGATARIVDLLLERLGHR